VISKAGILAMSRMVAQEKETIKFVLSLLSMVLSQISKSLLHGEFQVCRIIFDLENQNLTVDF